jgi:hypothetical protein
MKSKNTIELNGNLYDATTGKMLGAAQSAAPVTPATASPKVARPTKKTSGVNIDGFFRSRTSASATVRAAQATKENINVLAAPSPAPRHEPKPSRSLPNHAKAHKPQTSQRAVSSLSTPVKVHTPATSKPAHTAANHVSVHRPQSAVTLIRTAVKKPAPSLKAQTTVQGELAHQVPGRIEVKRHASTIDTNRLVRATTVSTSPMVSHHGKQPAKIETAVAPLAVQPVPVPVKPEGEVPSAAPAPQHGNNPQDIFNHALANASGFKDVREHRAHFRKHTRNHVASMAAGTLALLLIAVFAFYQNSPGMQIRVASVKAGVATQTPNFAAAGFAYNGATAANGKLTVGFTDGQGKYQLTQQATNWSSNDMIQDISATDASGKPNYSTINADGTTVYRFNNTGATWVSNGKWYSVTGTKALSNDQVKSIVENV